MNEPLSQRNMSAERQLFYITIGQGNSIWSAMENSLVEMATTLLGTTEEKAGLVLYSINFHTWLTIIDELFSLDRRFVSLKPDWGPIANKLKGLNDVRVRLAHQAGWGESKEGQSVLRPARYDVRSKSKKHKPLTADQIIDFSEAVRDAINAINSLNLRLYEANSLS